MNTSRLALILIIVLFLQLLTLAVQVAPVAGTLLVRHPSPSPVATVAPTLPAAAFSATPSAVAKPVHTITPSATTSGVVR